MESRNVPMRYGIALALVAVALELTLLVRVYLTATPTTLFFAAVAFAAWYGGTGPGLFSTVLSALAVDYFVVPPLYQFDLNLDHAIRLVVFVVVSLVISGLQESLRAARRRAEDREREARHELVERMRVEQERAALLRREREARRQAEAAQRRLAFLAEAGRLVAVSLDVQATLQNIGTLVVPSIADWCLVFMQQGDGTTRRVAVTGPPNADTIAAALRSRPPSSTLPDTPIGRRVLQQGERVLLTAIGEEVLDDLAEDAQHRRLLAEMNLSSLIIVPLQVHRQIFGAAAFATSTSPRTFGTEDLSLAEEVAGRAAAALSNAQLYEEAQDANRMKDEFLATVSHELRTPLHAILGWSRLLRSAKLDEEAVDRALETIERNALAQAQLVADILDVSRIVTGKLKLDMREVPAATVIESALDAVRPTAHAKGIELEVTIGDPTITLLADAGRLQQIVWNLLSNAIKFTPSGGHVAVDLRRADREAEIRITDSGIGIDREFLPYAFDRFRQADSSTSRSHGGLGLGLAIVRHLTELHGGAVNVESEGRGSGASFTVRLPAVPPYRAWRGLSRSEPPLHRLPDATLAGVRVLAVDDQADARELVSATLERYGATVITAASAREALALLDAERPHVLIGDIGMPDEDGYALIREVRARPADESGRVPAIALTAYARGEDHDRALDAGYQMHLPKPVDDVQLVRAVASVVGRATS